MYSIYYHLHVFHISSPTCIPSIITYIYSIYHHLHHLHVFHPLSPRCIPSIITYMYSSIIANMHSIYYHLHVFHLISPTCIPKFLYGLNSVFVIEFYCFLNDRFQITDAELTCSVIFKQRKLYFTDSCPLPINSFVILFKTFQMRKN